jgi:Amt family ammonium transporter
MTLPGLALFYGGLVRKKNVLSVLAQCLGITGLVAILWWLFGYSFVFGDEAGAVIGNFKKFAFLNGVDSAPNGNYSYWVSHNVFAMYQMMFAIITPALITGAFAERAKFGPFLVFMLAWSLLVYAPVAHWVFDIGVGDGAGWIAGDLKGLDFAGGTAIHVNAGAAALAAALVFGQRKGYKEEPMEPHDITMILLGTGILWFGWFGFNAGSAGAANAVAVNAFTVTCVAACAAALSWMFMSWWLGKKPSVVGAAAGAVAGLVAITPASGYVQPMEAIGIGAIAGILCFLAVQWRTKSSLDDSLDVVAVHGVGGLWGALATGIFVVAAANTGVNGVGEQIDGLTHGGGIDQLLRQAGGVAVVAPYSFIVTFIILKVLDLTVGIRVSEEDEVAGLDVSQHGERAYIFGGSGPVLGIPEAIPVHTPMPASAGSGVKTPSGSAG